MKQYRKDYPEIWFSVDYSHDEINGDDGPTHLHITAYDIDSLSEIQGESIRSEHIHLQGWIKFDGNGSFEMPQQTYFNGVFGMTNHCKLMKALWDEAQAVFPWSDIA